MRRYSRARRTPQSSLELSVLTGSDFRPITGDTIGETQADIVRRTNMDYDTFVNSAFLVQGRADLFAMATATQRKEVLSRVLGLGLYDRLEERAKLHNRELQGALSASGHHIDRLKEQVGQGAELRETFATVDAQLETAQARVTSVDERLALLRAHVEHLERRRGEAVELESQAARAGTRRDEANVEALNIERRLADWRKAEESATEIQEGFAALERARERLRTLNSAAQAVAGLQRELSPLEQRVSSAQASLEGEVRALRHRLEVELEPKAAALGDLEARLVEAAQALVQLDATSVETAKAVEEEQALRLEARRLEQDNVALVERGKETGNKLALLDHGHEDGVECPLCGTALEADARIRIEDAYNAEIAEQRTRYKTQAEEATRLDAQADEIGGKAKGLRERIESDRRTRTAEHARLTVERDEAAQAASLVDEARGGLGAAQSRLDAGEYAPDDQAAVRQLRERIAALAFDSHAVTAAEQASRELERWDGEHQALAQAQARRPEDEAALGRAQGRISEADEEITRIEEQRSAIAKEVAELDAYQEQRRQVDTEAAEAGGTRDELQARRGSLAHQIEELAVAERELGELESGRKTMVQEAGAYGELALAFGKGGVQALLIEAAIPRLEDEANDLLKQMTDGRMSLKLETQRARRTGRGADGSDSVETLDIVIADELGTRSYEMFSGGERFRIDFALRIALSKLLAWRAGAPLPTLFVDEGFGTQDVEGRDRILDVIRAIEDRFQRILVITHLEEIKEAFPVRIEVSRTSAGSTFSLS